MHRRLFACALTLALGVALGGGCEASQSNGACQRLQDFSCHCFPLCQTDLTDIIDSQDTQKCNQALKNAFDYWKRCDGTCTKNCEYAWGSCAFSHYQQVGESPAHPCTGGKDAGGDAG